MKWLKLAEKAGDPSYAVVAPADYYEWSFTGSPPESVRFSQSLPDSTVVANGNVIVSLDHPSGHPLIIAGPISSPKEIIQRLKERREAFDRSLDRFKQETRLKKFLLSDEGSPRLYGIRNAEEDEITLDYYGKAADVRDKIVEAHDMATKVISRKTGRAYEVENQRRLNHLVTMFSAYDIAIDHTELQNAIEKAGIHPKNSFAMSWKDCYLRTDRSAETWSTSLDRMSEMNWVKQLVNKTG